MSKQIEALKLALEALESARICIEIDSIDLEAEKAIIAIKEVLAHPEQEPVAYQDTAKPTELVAAENWDNIDPQWHWMYRPLYITPPYVATPRQRTWVSLDNDDIKKIAKKHKWHESNVEPHLIPVYRSLEIKLKEKNT